MCQFLNYYCDIFFFPAFVKTPHPLPGLTQATAVPQKPSALNPSQYLKYWLLRTKAAGVDGTTRITDRTTTGTITAGTRAGRPRTSTGTASPDKRAQMLKMISALEELHRTFNSTLSSRITIMSRGNDTVSINLSFICIYLKFDGNGKNLKCTKVFTVFFPDGIMVKLSTWNVYVN